jgi:hypothetical protein
MNNKMKFGIVMMLIASLSVALSNIPSIGAVAKTSPENQTMQPMPTIKSTKTIAIDMIQLRD